MPIPRWAFVFTRCVSTLTDVLWMILTSWHINNLMAQCTAKSKRSGERCKQPAMHGRDVCYMHGGKTPRGAASPHIKSGRWSKDLPTRLAARYAETEHDAELMSLRQDIRLIDALILQNFENLESGESAAAWEAMRKAVDNIEDGILAEQEGRVNAALRSMRDVIDRRILHYATETEIRSKLEQRRRLVETEHRMLLAGENAITIEQAMLMVGALAGILKAHIHDANVLTAIQQDIRQITHRQDVSRIG